MDQFYIIIIVLLLSAFFSGCEMAFISSNKLLIELNKKKYPRLSKIIEVFITHPSLFISALLIGNNIALVIYGLQMGTILEPFLQTYISNSMGVLLTKTLISTILILITAEFLPKAIFRINPILVLNITAVPLITFYIILYPISKLTVLFSEFTMKVILKKKHDSNYKPIVLGRIELDNLLTEHQENIEDKDNVVSEVRLLKNALDFSKIKVRECIIPRTEIQAIEVENTLEVLQQTFIDTGYSKILVYKESIDNIIGYIHVSQLFKQPTHLKNIISSLSIVPETMTANKLLALFTKEHRSIALVVDEFGGTAGIVTMEDILEEIVGEIDDEHDTSDLIERQISDNEFEFSGRAEIDFVNEKYNLHFPESENYETIAGYILHHHESIPKNDEIITINQYTFKIQVASNNRIELINIKLDSNN